MTYEGIKKRWCESKEGILEESDIGVVIKKEHFQGREWYFYKCPCRGDDHLAMRTFIEEGFSRHLSPVLNCFFTRKQWLVRPVDVAKVIKDEEEKYLKLIEKAPALVKKIVAKRGWSDETAFFLEDTHGIDRELAQSIIDGEM